MMIESIFKLIADQNKLAPPDDELSNLIKSIDSSNDEMDEWMLEQVTAARLEIMRNSEKKHNR